MMAAMNCIKHTGAGNSYILRIMDRGCRSGLADTGDGQLGGFPLGSHVQSLQMLPLDPCTAHELQRSKLCSRLWYGYDHFLYTLALLPGNKKCQNVRSLLDSWWLFSLLRNLLLWNLRVHHNIHRNPPLEYWHPEQVESSSHLQNLLF